MLAAAPGSAQAMRELARSALRTRRVNEASRLFAQLGAHVSTVDARPEYWGGRVLALHLSGRRDDALAVAREGRRRQPRAVTAYARH